MTMETTEFETLKEDWGELKLDDGIVLRFKQSLAFFFQDVSQPAVVSFRAPVLAESMSPTLLQGAPSAGPFEAASASLAREYRQADWELAANSTSLYELRDGRTLRFTLTPQLVRRYNYFHNSREPYLAVETVTLIELSPPPTPLMPPAGPSS